jgi:hypothetical protein
MYRRRPVCIGAFGLLVNIQPVSAFDFNLSPNIGTEQSVCPGGCGGYLEHCGIFCQDKLNLPGIKRSYSMNGRMSSLCGDGIHSQFDV